MTGDQAIQLALDAGRVFTPAAPVNERDLFAGRIRQLTQLADVVAQPGQHAIVYGERGVGKTSLANVFAILLKQSQTVVCPRVNCEHADSFSSVFRKVFSEISIRHTQPGIGFESNPIEQYRTISDSLPENISPQLARQILNDLGSNIRTIVILDEFDRLQIETADMFADFVKTLSDHVVPCTFIFVGVSKSVEALIHSHQSVERALVQVPMPRMSESEIGDILRRGFERVSLTADITMINNAAHLSQGLPHYAHLIGLYSVQIAKTQNVKNVDQFIFLEAVKKSVDNAQQSIRASYLRATRSPRLDSLFREVLLACAMAESDDEGFFQPAAVRAPMSKIMGKMYGIPSFARHLTSFAEEDRGSILERIGTERRHRYRFSNPLMQPFVLMRGLADGLTTSEQLNV
jgi:Cdc6-like AAA superfamily ATPase